MSPRITSHLTSTKPPIQALLYKVKTLKCLKADYKCKDSIESRLWQVLSTHKYKTRTEAFESGKHASLLVITQLKNNLLWDYTKIFKSYLFTSVIN